MKKTISLALLGATTTSLMALNADYASLYKDPRIMGMGGANVAVGGYASSVFHNPAGLLKISKDDGFVADLLNMNIEGSSNFKNFYDDYNDADTDSQKSDLSVKYSGEHFHFGVSNYSALSRHEEQFVWSVGVFSGVDANFITHGNGSRAGGFLENSTRIYNGLVLAGGVPYETGYGQLSVGSSLKILTQKSYEGTLGITEVTKNKDDTQALIDDLQEKYENSSTGVGFDIGVIFQPTVITELNILNPSLGLSILNIGNIGFDEFGGQPLMVNVGASINPTIPNIKNFVFAIDYIDMFEGNNLRVYGATDENGDVTYTDFTDSSFMKRFRVGASATVVESKIFDLTFNTGLYQSEITGGVDMRLGALRLNFTTYAQEIGTVNYSNVDRRYMFQMGINW